MSRDNRIRVAAEVYAETNEASLQQAQRQLENLGVSQKEVQRAEQLNRNYSQLAENLRRLEPVLEKLQGNAGKPRLVASDRESQELVQNLLAASKILDRMKTSGGEIRLTAQTQAVLSDLQGLHDEAIRISDKIGKRARSQITRAFKGIDIPAMVIEVDEVKISRQAINKARREAQKEMDTRPVKVRGVVEMDKRASAAAQREFTRIHKGNFSQLEQLRRNNERSEIASMTRIAQAAERLKPRTASKAGIAGDTIGTLLAPPRSKGATSSSTSREKVSEIERASEARIREAREVAAQEKRVLAEEEREIQRIEKARLENIARFITRIETRGAKEDSPAFTEKYQKTLSRFNQRQSSGKPALGSKELSVVEAQMRAREEAMERTYQEMEQARRQAQSATSLKIDHRHAALSAYTDGRLNGSPQAVELLQKLKSAGMPVQYGATGEKREHITKFISQQEAVSDRAVERLEGELSAIIEGRSTGVRGQSWDDFDRQLEAAFEEQINGEARRAEESAERARNLAASAEARQKRLEAEALEQRRQLRRSGKVRYGASGKPIPKKPIKQASFDTAPPSSKLSSLYPDIPDSDRLMEMAVRYDLDKSDTPLKFREIYKPEQTMRDIPARVRRHVGFVRNPMEALAGATVTRDGMTTFRPEVLLDAWGIETESLPTGADLSKNYVDDAAREANRRKGYERRLKITEGSVVADLVRKDPAFADLRRSLKKSGYMSKKRLSLNKEEISRALGTIVDPVEMIRALEDSLSVSDLYPTTPKAVLEETRREGEAHSRFFDSDFGLEEASQKALELKEFDYAGLGIDEEGMSHRQREASKSMKAFTSTLNKLAERVRSGGLTTTAAASIVEGYYETNKEELEKGLRAFGENYDDAETLKFLTNALEAQGGALELFEPDSNGRMGADFKFDDSLLQDAKGFLPKKELVDGTLAARTPLVMSEAAQQIKAMAASINTYPEEVRANPRELQKALQRDYSESYNRVLDAPIVIEPKEMASIDEMLEHEYKEIRGTNLRTEEDRHALDYDSKEAASRGRALKTTTLREVLDTRSTQATAAARLGHQYRVGHFDPKTRSIIRSPISRAQKELNDELETVWTEGIISLYRSQYDAEQARISAERRAALQEQLRRTPKQFASTQRINQELPYNYDFAGVPEDIRRALSEPALPKDFDPRKLTPSLALEEGLMRTSRGYDDGVGQGDYTKSYDTAALSDGVNQNDHHGRLDMSDQVAALGVSGMGDLGEAWQDLETRTDSFGDLQTQRGVVGISSQGLSWEEQRIFTGGKEEAAWREQIKREINSHYAQLEEVNERYKAISRSLKAAMDAGQPIDEIEEIKKERAAIAEERDLLNKKTPDIKNLEKFRDFRPEFHLLPNADTPFEIDGNRFHSPVHYLTAERYRWTDEQEAELLEQSRRAESGDSYAKGKLEELERRKQLQQQGYDLLTGRALDKRGNRIHVKGTGHALALVKRLEAEGNKGKQLPSNLQRELFGQANDAKFGSSVLREDGLTWGEHLRELVRGLGGSAVRVQTGHLGEDLREDLVGYINDYSAEIYRKQANTAPRVHKPPTPQAQEARTPEVETPKAEKKAAAALEDLAQAAVEAGAATSNGKAKPDQIDSDQVNKATPEQVIGLGNKNTAAELGEGIAIPIQENPELETRQVEKLKDSVENLAKETRKKHDGESGKSNEIRIKDNDELHDSITQSLNELEAERRKASLQKSLQKELIESKGASKETNKETKQPTPTSAGQGAPPVPPKPPATPPASAGEPEPPKPPRKAPEGKDAPEDADLYNNLNRFVRDNPIIDETLFDGGYSAYSREKGTLDQEKFFGFLESESNKSIENTKEVMGRVAQIYGESTTELLSKGAFEQVPEEWRSNASYREQLAQMSIENKRAGLERISAATGKDFGALTSVDKTSGMGSLLSYMRTISGMGINELGKQESKFIKSVSLYAERLRKHPELASSILAEAESALKAYQIERRGINEEASLAREKLIRDQASLGGPESNKGFRDLMREGRTDNQRYLYNLLSEKLGYDSSSELFDVQGGQKVSMAASLSNLTGLNLAGLAAVSEEAALELAGLADEVRSGSAEMHEARERAREILERDRQDGGGGDPEREARLRQFRQERDSLMYGEGETLSSRNRARAEHQQAMDDYLAGRTTVRPDDFRETFFERVERDFREGTNTTGYNEDMIQTGDQGAGATRARELARQRAEDQVLRRRAARGAITAGLVNMGAFAGGMALEALASTVIQSATDSMEAQKALLRAYEVQGVQTGDSGRYSTNREKIAQARAITNQAAADLGISRTEAANLYISLGEGGSRSVKEIKSDFEALKNIVEQTGANMQDVQAALDAFDEIGMESGLEFLEDYAGRYKFALEDVAQAATSASKSVFVSLSSEAEKQDVIAGMSALGESDKSFSSNLYVASEQAKRYEEAGQTARRGALKSEQEQTGIGAFVAGVGGAVENLTSLSAAQKEFNDVIENTMSLLAPFLGTLLAIVTGLMKFINIILEIVNAVPLLKEVIGIIGGLTAALYGLVAVLAILNGQSAAQFAAQLAGGTAGAARNARGLVGTLKNIYAWVVKLGKGLLGILSISKVTSMLRGLAGAARTLPILGGLFAGGAAGAAGVAGIAAAALPVAVAGLGVAALGYGASKLYQKYRANEEKKEIKREYDDVGNLNRTMGSSLFRRISGITDERAKQGRTDFFSKNLPLSREETIHTYARILNGELSDELTAVGLDPEETKEKIMELGNSGDEAMAKFGRKVRDAATEMAQLRLVTDSVMDAAEEAGKMALFDLRTQSRSSIAGRLGLNEETLTDADLKREANRIQLEKHVSNMRDSLKEQGWTMQDFRQKNRPGYMRYQETVMELEQSDIDLTLQAAEMRASRRELENSAEQNTVKRLQGQREIVEAQRAEVAERLQALNLAKLLGRSTADTQQYEDELLKLSKERVNVERQILDAKIAQTIEMSRHEQFWNKLSGGAQVGSLEEGFSLDALNAGEISISDLTGTQGNYEKLLLAVKADAESARESGDPDEIAAAELRLKQVEALFEAGALEYDARISEYNEAVAEINRRMKLPGDSADFLGPGGAKKLQEEAYAKLIASLAPIVAAINQTAGEISGGTNSFAQADGIVVTGAQGQYGTAQVKRGLGWNSGKLVRISREEAVGFVQGNGTITRNGAWHNSNMALDVAATLGQNVIAPKDAVVSFREWGHKVNGKWDDRSYHNGKRWVDTGNKKGGFGLQAIVYIPATGETYNVNHLDRERTKALVEAARANGGYIAVKAGGTFGFAGHSGNSVTGNPNAPKDKGPTHLDIGKRENPAGLMTASFDGSVSIAASTKQVATDNDSGEMAIDQNTFGVSGLSARDAKSIAEEQRAWAERNRAILNNSKAVQRAIANAREIENAGKGAQTEAEYYNNKRLANLRVDKATSDARYNMAQREINTKYGAVDGKAPSDPDQARLWRNEQAQANLEWRQRNQAIGFELGDAGADYFIGTVRDKLKQLGEQGDEDSLGVLQNKWSYLNKQLQSDEGQMLKFNNLPKYNDLRDTLRGLEQDIRNKRKDRDENKKNWGREIYLSYMESIFRGTGQWNEAKGIAEKIANDETLTEADRAKLGVDEDGNIVTPTKLGLLFAGGKVKERVGVLSRQFNADREAEIEGNHNTPWMVDYQGLKDQADANLEQASRVFDQQYKPYLGSLIPDQETYNRMKSAHLADLRRAVNTATDELDRFNEAMNSIRSQLLSSANSMGRLFYADNAQRAKDEMRQVEKEFGKDSEFYKLAKDNYQFAKILDTTQRTSQVKTREIEQKELTSDGEAHQLRLALAREIFRQKSTAKNEAGQLLMDSESINQLEHELFQPLREAGKQFKDAAEDFRKATEDMVISTAQMREMNSIQASLYNPDSSELTRILAANRQQVSNTSREAERTKEKERKDFISSADPYQAWQELRQGGGFSQEQIAEFDALFNNEGQMLDPSKTTEFLGQLFDATRGIAIDEHTAAEIVATHKETNLALGEKVKSLSDPLSNSDFLNSFLEPGDERTPKNVLDELAGNLSGYTSALAAREVDGKVQGIQDYDLLKQRSGEAQRVLDLLRSDEGLRIIEGIRQNKMNEVEAGVQMELAFTPKAKEVVASRLAGLQAGRADLMSQLETLLDIDENDAEGQEVLRNLRSGILNMGKTVMGVLASAIDEAFSFADNMAKREGEHIKEAYDRESRTGDVLVASKNYLDSQTDYVRREVARVANRPYQRLEAEILREASLHSDLRGKSISELQTMPTTGQEALDKKLAQLGALKTFEGAELMSMTPQELMQSLGDAGQVESILELRDSLDELNEQLRREIASRIFERQFANIRQNRELQREHMGPMFGDPEKRLADEMESLSRWIESLKQDQQTPLGKEMYQTLQDEIDKAEQEMVALTYKMQHLWSDYWREVAQMMYDGLKEGFVQSAVLVGKEVMGIVSDEDIRRENELDRMKNSGKTYDTLKENAQKRLAEAERQLRRGDLSKEERELWREQWTKAKSDVARYDDAGVQAREDYQYELDNQEGIEVQLTQIWANAAEKMTTGFIEKGATQFFDKVVGGQMDKMLEQLGLGAPEQVVKLDSTEFTAAVTTLKNDAASAAERQVSASQGMLSAAEKMNIAADKMGTGGYLGIAGSSTDLGFDIMKELGKTSFGDAGDNDGSFGTNYLDYLDALKGGVGPSPTDFGTSFTGFKTSIGELSVGIEKSTEATERLGDKFSTSFSTSRLSGFGEGFGTSMPTGGPRGGISTEVQVPSASAPISAPTAKAMSPREVKIRNLAALGVTTIGNMIPMPQTDSPLANYGLGVGKTIAMGAASHIIASGTAAGALSAGLGAAGGPIGIAIGAGLTILNSHLQAIKRNQEWERTHKFQNKFERLNNFGLEKGQYLEGTKWAPQVNVNLTEPLSSPSAQREMGRKISIETRQKTISRGVSG